MTCRSGWPTTCWDGFPVALTSAWRNGWRTSTHYVDEGLERCHSLQAATRSATLTADLYCQLVDRLASDIEVKSLDHSTTLFLHDSTFPNITKVTHQKPLAFEWKALPHSSHSPDLAPTDYYPFPLLSNAAAAETFTDEDDTVEQFADWTISTCQTQKRSTLQASEVKKSDGIWWSLLSFFSAF